MRVYYNLGFKEFNDNELARHMLDKGLVLNQGIIKSAEILERKKFSNLGNAVSGWMKTGEGHTYGFNVGGNPIGTGHENYIPFLEGMGCRKIFGLYNLESLVGKSLLFLEKRGVSPSTMGYITLGDVAEFMDLRSKEENL